MSEDDMFTVDQVETALKKRGVREDRSIINDVLYKLQALGYVLQYPNDQYQVNDPAHHRRQLHHI